MPNQSLSYTPSFITEYLPFSNYFFARIVFDDGVFRDVSGASFSIASLSDLTISDANLRDVNLFKKELGFFATSNELRFTSIVGAGYLLKGYAADIPALAKIQIFQQGITAAAGDIKFTSNIVNGVTLSLGVNGTFRTYRFVNTIIQPYDVKIGITASDTLDNLRRAINGDGVVNTNYFTGTSVNQIFTAAINGNVLTYSDKIPCKRLQPYYIVASSYSDISIRTPIGGVDGDLMVEIPSSSNITSFKDIAKKTVFDYSFGKRETYSSISSVFIPLFEKTGGISEVFYSDIISLNGFYKPSVAVNFGLATNASGQSGSWTTAYYNNTSGSDIFLLQVDSPVVTTVPNPVVYNVAYQADNVRFSLNLGLNNNICNFFLATAFY